MALSEALNFDGLAYFYKKYIKPIKQTAYCSVVNNGTTTVTDTVLDGRMGKTLADKDTDLQNQINDLSNQFTNGDVKRIMITSLKISDISADALTTYIVYFSCPYTPVAIIPVVHGSFPLVCTVNQWSNSSAAITVKNIGSTSTTNRTIQIVIIY